MTALMGCHVNAFMRDVVCLGRILRRRLRGYVSLSLCSFPAGYLDRYEGQMVWAVYRVGGFFYTNNLEKAGGITVQNVIIGG
jgi:hypothetical protein